MESTGPHVIFNGKGQVEGEAFCPFIALRSEFTEGRGSQFILAGQPFQYFYTTKQVLPEGEYTDVDSGWALAVSDSLILKCVRREVCTCIRNNGCKTRNLCRRALAGQAREGRGSSAESSSLCHLCNQIPRTDLIARLHCPSV